MTTAASPMKAFLQHDRIYDLVALITVVAGYLVSILAASHLSIFNFVVATGLNLAWALVYLRMQADEDCSKTQRYRYLGAQCVLAVIIMVSAHLGLGFDWLIPLATIGLAASIVELKTSVLIGVGLFVATMAILLSLSRGFSPDFFGSSATLSPAFLFVFAFSYMARQQQMERERAEQLLRELSASNAALAEAHRHLQAHAEEVEELTIARERNRMAREIHDTLGHYLTILALQLETASQLEDRHDPRLRAELLEARRVASECLGEVRHSMAALRPADPTAASFADALRHLIAEFEAVSPMTDVTLDLDDAAQTLAPEIRVTLFRCVQEALTNIRKHAQATKVLVRLRVAASQVELMVLDNGKGAAVATKATTTGYGLVGMRERLALLAGTVMAEPEPEQGWRVEVRIPSMAASQMPVAATLVAMAEE